MSLEQLYQTRAILTSQLLEVEKLIAEAQVSRPVVDEVHPPRMRTVSEAVNMLREADSGTRVTQYFIKSLIANGIVKVNEAGGRKLINYDKLLEYLNGTAPIEKPVSAKIRRLDG